MKIKQCLEQRKHPVMMGMLYWLGCNLCLYKAARSFDIHLWLFLAFCNLSLTFSWHSDSAVSIPRPWLSICVWFLALIQRAQGSAIFIELFFLLIFISISFIPSFLLSLKRHPSGGMLSPSPSQRGVPYLYGLLMSNSEFTHTDWWLKGNVATHRTLNESQLCFNAVTLSVHGVHQCL